MRECIGIMTGGGDCPGLNAVIRAVVKSATKRGWDTLGFLGGYEGLLEPMRYRHLDYKEMDALLFVGGTILGTSNKGRFAAKTGHGDLRQIPQDILDEARANFRKLGLRALVTVGGDASLTIAQRLFEHGIPLVRSWFCLQAPRGCRRPDPRGDRTLRRERGRYIADPRGGGIWWGAKDGAT